MRITLDGFDVFAPGDHVVFIDAPDIRARVTCVSMRPELTYQLVWFHDGARREEWVYGQEVTAP